MRSIPEAGEIGKQIGSLLRVDQLEEILFKSIVESINKYKSRKYDIYSVIIVSCISVPLDVTMGLLYILFLLHVVGKFAVPTSNLRISHFYLT